MNSEFLYKCGSPETEKKYVVGFHSVQFPYGMTRLQRCSHPVVSFFDALDSTIKMLTTVEGMLYPITRVKRIKKVCSFVVMIFKNKDNAILNPTTNMTTMNVVNVVTPCFSHENLVTDNSITKVET
ncbi:MAG: hypothetical protein QXU98_12995 [Candidatus Parvarchaeota archaeon]